MQIVIMMWAPQASFWILRVTGTEAKIDSDKHLENSGTFH